MLNELTKEQLELAKYMSELSELACNSSWVEGLEIALWIGMNSQSDQFYRLTFNDEIRIKLNELSHNCGGWIIYDDKDEEKFVDFDEWNKSH
ncbi:hypothetical protein A9Q93_03855 [Nonlabens dokdonensis]|uniref:Uncharacterized protein n=1 Tax=Nonlabens dokdonensis TaxID=328515 RepID=A0A1Z8B7J1_9FLAO|nr:hypothetical protein [Nonlabens dokdonensis]OUS18561.1 hypothetical protein A9Q93_03855 [Nonlabens dokdonensis]